MNREFFKKSSDFSWISAFLISAYVFKTAQFCHFWSTVICKVRVKLQL